MANHNASGPRAADRDPAKICGTRPDGSTCYNWKMKGSETCYQHVGPSPAAKDRAKVAKITTELGLKPMPARDWLEHAGQIVASLQDDNDRMDVDLNLDRDLTNKSEIEIQREYADIFQVKRDNIALMAKVTGSVASLALAKAARDAIPKPPPVPPREKLAAALEGMAQRMNLLGSTGGHCRTCTCGEPADVAEDGDVVDGEIVEGD